MDKSPRPILKRSSSSSSSSSHTVHFPPSPALTRTFFAHSPAHYDRSPIVVGPNDCALPERGGRTYVLDDQSSSSRRRSPSKSGRVLHPRAMARETPSVMPPLIPDLSSESDESDGFSSPYTEKQELYYAPASQHCLKAPDDTADLLAFLPHSPSNPYYQPTEDQSVHSESSRRFKERSRTPRRKSSSSRSPSYSTQCPSSSALCDSFSSFALRDDGCLGGF